MNFTSIRHECQIKSKPLQLISASEKLKKDREIVLAAVTNTHDALIFLNPSLRHITDIISDSLRANPNIISEIMKKNGFALAFASDALQANPDIVLEAVKQNGLALEHASVALQNDYATVLAAVQQNPSAVEFAGITLLLKNNDILMTAANSGRKLTPNSARLVEFFKSRIEPQTVALEQTDSLRNNI